MDLFLPDFVLPFVEALNEKRKESTVKRYMRDISDFFKWLNSRYDVVDGEVWGDLNRSVYQDFFTYLREKDYSDASVKRICAALNQLIKFYKLQDHLGGLLTPGADQRALTSDDFISDTDFKKLCKSIKNLHGITDEQVSLRYYLADRNLSIVMLMYVYGLTLDETVSLSMNNFNFAQGELVLFSDKGSRYINLDEKDTMIFTRYYQTIPELFRPKRNSQDPFFIAFNSKKKTYRYDYHNVQPKRLTKIAMQKTIYNEFERAGLKNLSPTHLRNSRILSAIRDKWSNEELIRYFGLTSRHALYRIKRYSKK